MPANPNQRTDGNETTEIKKDRDRQLQTLIGLSERFGDSLTNAFAKNIAEGRTSRLNPIRGNLGVYARSLDRIIHSKIFYAFCFEAKN